MIGFLARLFGHRILLLLIPLGLLGVLIGESNKAVLPGETLGSGFPIAQLLPSGELARHQDHGPDPFDSRPQWAYLPGLDSLWEFEKASSGQVQSSSRSRLKMPPVETEPRLAENADGHLVVRIDYPDGSLYEAFPEQWESSRDWLGVEFISSQQPGVVQFVTDIEDAQHPLIGRMGTDVSPALPFDEIYEVHEVIDEVTTVYRADFPRQRYFEEAAIDGESVTFELTAIEYQRHWPRDTIMFARFAPAQRHPLVAGVLPALPWTGIVVGGVGVLALVLNLVGVDRRSRQLAERMMASLAGQMLVERWLKRSRYFRLIGATVFGLLYLGRNRNGSFHVELFSLVFWMFVGIAVGGAIAELRLFRRPADHPALADLQPRSITDFTTIRDRTAMTLIGAASAVLVVLRLTNVLSGSLFWSLLALGLVLVAFGFQHVVADRRRPAVSGVLRNADNVLRFLASTRGFGRPATAAACIALARALLWDSAPTWVGWAALTVILTGIAWFASGSERRLRKLAEVRLAL